MPIPSWIRTQRVLPLLLIGLSGCDAHDMSMAPDGAVADAAAGQDQASAACRLCLPNQKCVQDTCMDDPDRIWTLKVTAVTIKSQDAGKSWDPADLSAPDPYFLVAWTGATMPCTSKSENLLDTTSPSWTTACSLPAKALFNTRSLILGFYDADSGPMDQEIATPKGILVEPSKLVQGVYEVDMIWDGLASKPMLRLEAQ